MTRLRSKATARQDSPESNAKTQTEALLRMAWHALEAYAAGNSSPDLAVECAAKLRMAIQGTKGAKVGRGSSRAATLEDRIEITRLGRQIWPHLVGIAERPDTSQWKCRGCGCTDTKACKGGCGWVEENLCDRCLAWSDRFTPAELQLLDYALQCRLQRKLTTRAVLLIHGMRNRMAPALREIRKAKK